jgi:hypothetical protein
LSGGEENVSDVGAYPFRRARHFHEGRRRDIRLIVLHSMESAEKGDTAEDVARYFQTTDREASAHLCVDNNSIIRCVHDDDTAFAAKSANADGLHIEHAGRAAQSRAQWLDAYSKPTLELSAKAAAAWAKAYGIPVRRLNVDQVRAGLEGFTDHDTISRAYPGTGHTDPGPHFPWDTYLDMVRRHLGSQTTSTSTEDFIVATKDELRALLAEQTEDITGGRRVRDENGNVIDADGVNISTADLYTAVEKLSAKVDALAARIQ